MRGIDKKCIKCESKDRHVNQEPCKTCMKSGYPDKKIKWVEIIK